MSPEKVVIDYFENLIQTKQPDWSYFAKGPNFIMKKLYIAGAKYFEEFIGTQLLTENENKAVVLYAITNTKGKIHQFACTLKKVDGEWKIKTFDNYDIERVQKVQKFFKKQKCTLAKSGKMEVAKPPKIPICEVHFHGFAVRTASLPLL